MSTVTDHLVKQRSLSTHAESHARNQGRKCNKVQSASSCNPKDTSDEERGLDSMRTEHSRNPNDTTYIKGYLSPNDISQDAPRGRTNDHARKLGQHRILDA